MKFSVILPFYNGRQFIKQAIDSVIEQSYHDWELIIVDDGSNKENETYLLDLLNVYNSDKIRYFRKKNEDVAVARNFGIKNSTGKYICLLDQDDFFHDRKLEKVQNLVEKDSSIDVIICNRYKVTLYNTSPDKGAKKRKKKTFNGNLIKNILLGPNIMPVETVIRKEKAIEIGGFDPALRMANDWDMILRLAKENAKFYYLDEYLAYYRMHGDNTSHKHEGFVDERFIALNKFFNNNTYSKYKNRAFATAYLESANPRYKSGMFKKFRSDVYHIIKLAPSVLTLKVCLRYFKSFFLRGNNAL